MTYTTASCFNKLCLLHCTTGKSLKSIVAAECVEGYARTPVKELKSRRHLTLSVLDVQRDGEPGRGKPWANSTEGPSQVTQDVASLQSTQVQPFVKN